MTVFLGEDAMHTAKLSVDARYAPIWEFTCHAPIGASCRLVCVEGCEEVDTQNHDHELKDCGECQYVLWLDNDDAMVECQKGGTFLAWEGPVKIEWENDHYEFTPLTAERDALKTENATLRATIERALDAANPTDDDVYTQNEALMVVTDILGAPKLQIDGERKIELLRGDPGGVIEILSPDAVVHLEDGKETE